VIGHVSGIFWARDDSDRRRRQSKERRRNDIELPVEILIVPLPGAFFSSSASRESGKVVVDVFRRLHSEPFG